MRAPYDVAKNYRDALLTATLPIVPVESNAADFDRYRRGRVKLLNLTELVPSLALLPLAVSQDESEV